MQNTFGIKKRGQVIILDAFYLAILLMQTILYMAIL